MYDITTPVYLLSTFWGYRLLKQCRSQGTWFHRLLAPAFGLVLLLGPWVIGLGNLLGHGLLSALLLGISADLISNRASGKPLFQLMSFDEKLLFFLAAAGAIGWAVYQLI